MKKVENNTMKIKGCTLVYPDDLDLEQELMENYRDILLTGKPRNNTWLAKVLEKDFAKLQAEDTYNALSVIKEVGKIAKTTTDYFNKKKEGDVDFISFMLDKNLMPWQREVLRDLSKRIVSFAGRRAGKTYEIASHMIDHCLKGFDEVNGVKKYREAIYIGLTLEKAAAVIWDILISTIEKCKVPVKKRDNGLYRIEFSNGSAIQLLGNNSKADREKIRGFDSSMFVIDECQSQQGLLYLVNSIIGPIIKGRDGVLMLSGTAPLSAGTFWEDAINSGTYSVHHATMEDNITIPDHEHALQQVLEENHWTEDNITFRREYLGEIAYDTNLLVYPFRHYYEDLPKVQWKCCYIGIDYGWTDSTAIAPILIDNDGNMYLVNAFKQSGMSSSSIIDKVKATVEFITKTYNVPSTYIRVIDDCNGGNITRDIYNAGVTQIQHAYKQGESYQISLVIEALDSGTLKIKKDDYFDDECNKMVWKWNQEKGAVIYELDDATYHGDICDAVKYAVATYYSDNVTDSK